MPRLYKIGAALLLAASLVSCSSLPVSEPSSGSSGDPPTTIQPEAYSTDTAIITEKPSEQTKEPSTPSASSKPSHTKPDKHPEASPPTVEASTIDPPSKETLSSPEPSFEPKSPSLAGIKLGAADKDVVKHFGLPVETYPLPDDDQTIEIWEYAGFSVGLNETDKVVYIEITSNKVSTGINGLLNGMDGSQAAELLGIQSDTQSNVLAVEVSGGWFKLDLDPDTQKVLSLKLLSREI